jgi:hypothetical protein
MTSTTTRATTAPSLVCAFFAILSYDNDPEAYGNDPEAYGTMA